MTHVGEGVGDRDEDERSSYMSGYKGKLSNRTIKSGKATPMLKTTKKPLEVPASNAPSSSPFKIVQGIKTTEQWLKIFVYGDYGAGKTVFAASAADVPSMNDILFIDIEGGRTSIKGSKAIENYGDIDFIPCNNFETFVAIHKMLLAYCQARDDEDEERLKRMAERYEFPELTRRRYKTVIVDSLSELNQISLQRAFGENPNDLLGTTDSDDTRRDFGRNKQAMMKTVRAFRNLPMHVVMTCGRQWDEDERKKLGYQPRLTGQLAKEVQAIFDLVGYMQTAAVADGGEGGEDKKIGRRLWLQPVGKFDAKNRLSSQEVTYLDDPNMSSLVGLLTNKAIKK